jgi:hypothetical protein
MGTGHPRPDQLFNQFATHDFSRCKRVNLHFYRQPDEYVQLKATTTTFPLLILSDTSG